MIRKGLVIGIIILFVGASITTVIGSNIKKDFSNEKNKIYDVKDSYRNDWWDEDWVYRKKIEISNAFSDCQILITVWREDGYDNVSNGVIDCENHCNDDFTDIRFIDSNGSILSYWIEEIIFDGDLCAKIWVKLSDQATIYLYYGYPNASDLSNGDDTFIFFDHFEEDSLNTTKWDTSIAGGYYYDNINSRIGFYGNWDFGGIGRVLKIKDSYMDFSLPISIEARFLGSTPGDMDIFTTFNCTQLGPDRLIWDQLSSGNPGFGITIGYDGEGFGTGFRSGKCYRGGGSFTTSNHSIWGEWDKNYYKNGVAGSTIGYVGIGADTDDNSRYGYFDWFAVRKFCLTEPFISFIGSEEIASEPPYAPIIDGPTTGKPGVEYSYYANTTDPDGDHVYYKWDWGDNSYSDWLGPYDSGIEIPASHAWSRGSFEIRVKAKDTRGLESEWSDPFPITMPRDKAIVNLLFLKLLERFPLLERLLNLWFLGGERYV